MYCDDKLLERVLSPYYSNCHYLRTANVYVGEDNKQGCTPLMAKGEFSIIRSCYIQDTGHFNAVEFNLCYNQLAYYLLAMSVKHHLLDIFTDWNMAQFLQQQLTHFYIVKFNSRYYKPIHPKEFFGVIEIEKVSTKNKKSTFLYTKCSFFDNQNGQSEGQVLINIKNNDTL